MCFIDDMTKSSTQGGRLVIPHLELQAGIISKELQNASMENEQRIWCDLARNGLCTMDPFIGEWIRNTMGWDTANYIYNNAMKFNDLLKAFGRYDLRNNDEPTVSNALLYIVVYHELLDLAKTSVARDE